MKKTFIKPEAHTLAMQTENMILAGSATLNQAGSDEVDTKAIAEAKRGPQSGPITSTTFAWN